MKHKCFLASAILLLCPMLVVAQGPQGPPLTRVATPRTFTDVVYPPVARLGRVEGAVIVSVAINERGMVESATATGGPDVLLAVARENAREWEFLAGPKRTVDIVYVFEIEGYCAKGSAPTLTRVVSPFNVVKATTCHDWQP